jgi:AraC-like DNA-binding protein
MTDRTVAAGMARALFDYAVTEGASADELAERANVNRDDLLDHDNRVPFASYVALVRAAKDLCGDPALPLHFAEAVDPSEFSVVGLLTHASETMLDAMTQINRYDPLIAEMELRGPQRFVFEQTGYSHWVVDTRANPNDFPEATETTFTRLICGPRRFLPRPHILEVEVTHPAPSHRAEYDRIWCVPVTFEAKRNAMRMDPSIYTWRVQLQPRYMFSVLSAHADALLQELERSKTVRGRVESLIMPILHRGEVNAEVIANRMGLSRQTVYRKLKAEGVTFEQVLDSLRHKLALHYLRSKRISVHETAYLVGFSDPAAFSRAFKRWTGTTPRTMRLAKGQELQD